MLKNFTGARLGLFVFLGTALLVTAIFLIGGRESLFQSTFTIKAMFATVEGLRTGAPVRLSGINVGSVSEIEIANDTTGRVVVTMRVNSDIKNFIRKDTRATIETEGLVGNKIVVLTVGTTAYEIVKDGGFVRSKSPVSIAEIIAESQGTLNYLKDITKDFSEIVSKINNGEGTIGKIVNDDELYNSATQITKSADRSLNTITTKLNEISDIVKNTTGDFQKIISDLDNTILKVDNVVDNVRQGKGLLGQLVSDKSTYSDSVKAIVKNLTATTEQVKVGASRFSENMEALKHNWLFKSYFEERGYWDANEYEKNIDSKLSEIKEKTRTLDQKIKELKSLENNTGTRTR
ncbi:MAG: MlaD family protein [Bacteroidota bacterium]|jgi:phospholipid/cholesterol/gamma-HCH transport system substrate-binding protein|nr:MCE family protein [Ignavibacteria bacterium]MCU7499422.1 MCE family protein [Ignavibacteria bacterium]MCU7511552.1 MCE family protein [Ignavibacteria bacterium]MCU7521057.1 MCE family protein [Ignavibacteria bacterium]MCU7524322.1 MCE family protein [Ignavibacteria bacterium]